MPYLRQRGNQLALVHGERDPETKKVEQRILFTIYSKAEALEMLGRGESGGAERFRGLLEHQYPDLKFDWKAIRKAVSDNVDVLPDQYQYREERLQGRFRQDLAAFVRQLTLADPQNLLASAQLIQDNREELLYLADLISWRLKLCDQKESEWNRDNPFYWRFTLQGREVPPDAEEHAIGYWERRELKRAKAVFGLLVEAFDGYAEGHNYVGLVAEEEGRLDDALVEYGKTAELGRRLFPKRIARSRYWRDHVTRPYMRGLRNQSLVLNRLGRYREARDLCARLEQECSDRDFAVVHGAAISLNTGEWQKAAEGSGRYINIWASESFVVAFARFELGERDEAVAAFLHAALNYPRTARMLLGERTPNPKTGDEVDDHNTGVGLLRSLAGYLADRKRSAFKFFRELMANPGFAALVTEAEDVRRKWHENRSGDRRWFERMQEMKSPLFARARARELGLGVGRSHRQGRNTPRALRTLN